MSVTRQSNILGQQRWDVPHHRAVESSIANDFDLLAGRIVAGGAAQIVSGFGLITSPNPVGGPASNILVNVQDGVLLHPLASDSGTIFKVPAGRTTEQLNSTNTRVEGSWVAGSYNYVGVDLRRSTDSSTSDSVMFIDPVSLKESPRTVPLARTMDYKLVISITDFTSNASVAPIAIVEVDSNGNVSSIEYASQGLFRLGAGGTDPNPQHGFPWPHGRTETSNTFTGGDKSITSLKDWMDAVMSRIQETNGGAYWYSPVNSHNIKMARTGTPLANGEYFDWDGTVLKWTGLSFLLHNNSSATINEIAENTSTGITMSDGDCLYVDLDFTVNRTSGGSNQLIMQKATRATLGASSVPGARFIVAWRIGSEIYTRDGYFPVGMLFNYATDTTLGAVRLLTAANTTNDPVVPTIDTATQMVVAAGLSRNGTAGSISAGAITIGGGADDSSVIIGKDTTNTTILGTLKIDAVTVDGDSRIAASSAIYATASTSGDSGLKGTGLGTGYGLYGVGGATNGDGVRGDGTGNGSGVVGKATGATYAAGFLAGVTGLGGSSGGSYGPGGQFVSLGSADGVYARASGTGAGLKALSPYGYGVDVQSGGILVQAGGVDVQLGGILVQAGGVESQGAYDVSSGRDVIATKKLQSNQTRSGTSTPTDSVYLGEAWKESFPIAWARTKMTAATTMGLVRGFNINSVSRSATGKYKIIIATSTDINHLVPVVTVMSMTATICNIEQTPTTTTFYVLTFDQAGVATEMALDDGLMVVVYAG